MIVIGLTGGIGMGKSTAAKILRGLGLPIHSADKAVHDALKKGGPAVAAIAALFPAALKRGGIDRALLSHAVFSDPRKLRQIERILHPLARQAERAFLQKARQKKARAAVLEIPLLFETGADKRCDVTLCVTAPRAAQKARVLARPRMTEEKLRTILARQMPDAEKRKRADFTVPTGQGLEATENRLRAILARIIPTALNSDTQGPLVSAPTDAAAAYAAEDPQFSSKTRRSQN